MDQDTRNYIEQSLNIKVGAQIGRSDYAYTGSLNEAVIRELVANVFTAVEWQDPKSPDCGNDDGILYVYLPSTDDVGELFIGVNATDGIIYIS